MPPSGLDPESLLFIPVDSLCRSPVVTCSPDLEVVSIARLMRQHDISGLIVVIDEMPVGIVTLRDLRNLIAETGGTVVGTRARDIMATELVTIRRRDYVFSAIFKMAKFKIHRLVVLDDRGKLVGVVTDTDLLNLQTKTPLYLTQEIEAANSIEQLRRLNQRILDMVNFAARAGAETRSLVHLISHFNDVCTHRLIALLERDEGIRLPAGAAYLALGSEGRGEQTMRTDQDSAMVYRDDLAAADLEAAAHFASRLVEALETIGVPRCPGDTMASNPAWRHTLSEWKQLLDHWITVPKPDNMVNFGMFQDLRTLHGEPSLEQELHDHILAGVKRHSLFLPYVARNVVRFQPPLGMFGRIRVERRGPCRGKVDLKKAGIFALTEGVSLLALEAGVVGGSTWEKIDRLKELGILSIRDLEAVDEAYTHLVQLRLQKQIRALAAGTKPTNYVDPLVLTDKERDQLRQALKEVGQFLKIIHDHYQLDFISR